MKQLLTGIAIFAGVALVCFFVLTGPLGLGQGLAAVIALVLGGIFEWAFHRNVNRM
ncbi:hypothetical protein [Alteribacter keqinensis]|uniref:hypothetical protein n=1 Tax=Alteribacter keqinensis TaxID=2483800 RepID=UPI0016065636|nr:hypothetical protein [Alteribacter keqinensis]